MTKHNNPTFREIAENNLILKARVGSRMHGVTTGDGDEDQMGVCIEPQEWVIGIQNPPFEQYEHRTQPDHTRSGAGDLDLTVYSLRKYVRLAAAGNPTILLTLFAQPEHLLVQTGIGKELQASSGLFVTRVAARKFMGYLQSQKARMNGELSQRTNRPELVAVHGFDTKFAYHMVRLGLQGVELMETGSVTLPIPEPHRAWLLELRNGEHSKAEALAKADELFDRLKWLSENADVPERPDMDQINRKLLGWYGRHWSSKEIAEVRGQWPTPQSYG